MEFESYTKIKNRVKAVTPREGERIKMTPNGINLEIIYLHHGRSRPIENLGFIFEISGKNHFILVIQKPMKKICKFTISLKIILISLF